MSLSYEFSLAERPLEISKQPTRFYFPGVGDQEKRLRPIFDSLRSAEETNVYVRQLQKPAAHQQGGIWFNLLTKDCTRGIERDPEKNGMINSLKAAVRKVHELWDSFVAHGYSASKISAWGIGDGGIVAMAAAATYRHKIAAVVGFETTPLLSNITYNSYTRLGWRQEVPMFIRLGLLSRRCSPKELSRQVYMLQKSGYLKNEELFSYFLNPKAVDSYDMTPYDCYHIREFLRRHVY